MGGSFVSFEDYRDRYETIRMERHDGVLELTFHTDGGPLQWSAAGSHADCADAFAQIARDEGNEVVIMTGTGDAFSGPLGDTTSVPRLSPRGWETIRRHGLQLTRGLLDIEAIVISAVNGPAIRHPEIPLVADIVLAADTATFQDSAHFRAGVVPGDGLHYLLPALMGPNRARYFALTGQVLGVQEAKDLGLVAEILPREQLLPRARELAELVLRQPLLTRRYTKLVMTESLRRSTQELLGYGLALEGLAIADEVAGQG
ncbi:enoyl-CoA hydratase/isomerase family protein [Baekduia soli]|uniref:Enoyl-CoA hydratase/isomerase family protein n=1 Tax=Baekduia soli TaxID=496014 RepID=A0A5B8U0A9_9ACTN|nr:enoyl-CoA hydratase/isomerase family protein [Baekduia soli]QEC46433.1 enoyl-CoA hydratase/isomerase family protein [Baekduia soli]